MPNQAVLQETLNICLFYQTMQKFYLGKVIHPFFFLPLCKIGYISMYFLCLVNPVKQCQTVYYTIYNSPNVF